jgi:type VI protein secretion system component Hcp
VPALESLEQRTLLSAATHVAFVQQPDSTTTGAAIGPPVSVQLLDQFNNPVTNGAYPVSVSLQNDPTGATLGGTTTAAATGGVATFDNLSVSKPGTGYTLAASDPAIANPTILLSLTPAAGASAVVVPVDAFSVSFSPGEKLGISGDLSLQIGTSAADPGLLANLATGEQLAHAALYVRDTAAKGALVYHFTGVTVTGLSTTGSGDTPTDSLTLHFDTAKELFLPSSDPRGTTGPPAGWTQITSTGPNSGIGIPLKSFHDGGGDAPAIGLSLGNPGDATLLPVRSFSLGATSSDGKVQLSDLTLQFDASASDPAILNLVTTGAQTGTAALYAREPGSQGFLVYHLSRVSFGGLSTSGSGDTPSDSLSVAFTKVTESFLTPSDTKGASNGAPPAGWDQVTNTDGGSGAPMALDALPGASGGNTPAANTPSTGPAPVIGLSLGKPGSKILPVLSFSISVTNPASIAGNGAGKAQLNDLHLQLDAGAADPGLLKELETDAHFGTAALYARDPGAKGFLVYQFTEVFVTGLSTSGSGDTPVDSLTLAYGKLKEAFALDNKGTGAPPAGWDLVGLTEEGPGASTAFDALPGSPGGNTPAASDPTTGPAPAIGLSVNGKFLPVLSFSVGAANTGNLADPGAGAGKVQFSDLVVQVDAGAVVPDLFKALLTGGHLSGAALYVRDPAAKGFLVYHFSVVFVTSLSTIDSGDTPVDSLTLKFGEEKESFVSASDQKGPGTGAPPAGWDLVGLTDKGPAAPMALDALPGTPGVNSPADMNPSTGPAPAIGLSLGGIGGKVLPVVSYSLGATNSDGQVHLDDLVVQLDAGAADPALFKALDLGKHLTGAALYVRNAAGGFLVYHFSTVQITSLLTEGSGGTATDSLSLQFDKVTESLTPSKTKDGSPPAGWDLVGTDGSTANPQAPGAGTATDTPTIVGPPDGSPVPRIGLSLAGASGDAIPVVEFSLSSTHPASRGAAQVGDLTVQLDAGAADPGLLATLISGQPLLDATLRVRNAAGQVYLTLKLTDVTLAGLSTADSAGDAGPVDSLTLHGEWVEEVVRPVTADVNSKSSVKVTVDTKTGRLVGQAPAIVGQTTPQTDAVSRPFNVVSSVQKLPPLMKQGVDNLGPFSAPTSAPTGEAQVQTVDPAGPTGPVFGQKVMTPTTPGGAATLPFSAMLGKELAVLASDGFFAAWSDWFFAELADLESVWSRVSLLHG